MRTIPEVLERKPTPNVRLKYERERRGWTQNDVAGELSNRCSEEELDKHGFIDGKRVSVWERGIHKPDRFWRLKLCELYGKSLEELESIQSLDGDESETFHTRIPSPSSYQTSISNSSKSDIQVNAGEQKNNDVSLTQGLGNSQGNIGQLLFDIGIWILSLAKQQGSWPHSDFLKYVVSALENSKDMKQRKLSRREALDLLVKLPMALIGAAPTVDFFREEEVVSLCATSITACWSLFWAGEFSAVEATLPTYFSQLTPLAQRSLTSQKTAAGLLSQAHQIASLLVLEREDFGTSLAHCKQASLYGQIAGDPNLQAASLIRRANSLFYRNTVPYLKRHTQILETYQEALQ